MGLISGILVDTVVNRNVVKRPNFQLLFWCTTLILFWILGFVPLFSLVDNFVHVWGFVHGLFASLASVPFHEKQDKSWKKQTIRGIGIFGSIFFLVLGLYILYFGPKVDVRMID